MMANATASVFEKGDLTRAEPGWELDA